MTEENIINIIKNAYGYEIIVKTEKKALKDSSDVIFAEFGVDTLFEFLSFNISEFSGIRKTIHARRFFYVYKEIFSLGKFNMEAYHKIQAGMLYIIALSGNFRGIDEYKYSGFVKEVLDQLYYKRKDTEDISMPIEKLMYMKNILDKLGRVSTGVYSLQIFTKYNMAMQEINLPIEGYINQLFLDITGDIEKKKNPIEKMRKLLSLESASIDSIDEITGEYIEYSCEDIFSYSMTYGSKKDTKAKEKLINGIKLEVEGALVGLKRDTEDIRILRIKLLEKIKIFEEDPYGEAAKIYVDLLDRLVYSYERLRFYEDVSFAKYINMIFINRMEKIFNSQSKTEMTIIRKDCKKIIEENIPGFSVFELEGVLESLTAKKGKLDSWCEIKPENSASALEKVNRYLNEHINIISKIQKDMRHNLKNILNTDQMSEKEVKMLKLIIYDFKVVIAFLQEED